MKLENDEVRNLSEALAALSESISSYQQGLESVDASLAGPALRKGRRLLQEATEFAADLDATLREIRFLPPPRTPSRSASVDDVVRAFDSAIDRWVSSKERELAAAHGPEEASRMAESLAEWIYHDIELEPSHLDRFVKFYVDDVKLSDALDEFLSGFAGDASRAASALRQVASSIGGSGPRGRSEAVRLLTAALSLLPR